MNRNLKLILAFFLLIFAGSAQAQQFTVPIDVTDGANTLTLNLGVHPAGTDGFDSGLDLLAPPPPPVGPFDARLRQGANDFLTDIRGNAQSAKTFTILYSAQSVPTVEGPIVLSWNSAALAALGAFTITDNITGGLFTLNMLTASSLDVSTTGGLLASGLRVVVTPSAPAALDADFNANPVSGAAPLAVNFSNTSTPGASAIDSLVWDFGDGTSVADEQNPVHVYTAPGLYTVSLTAFDASGSDTETKVGLIEVFGGPTADFSGTPTSGSTPLVVSFSDVSTQGSGAITSYAWDFGDGSTSSSQNPSHTYTSPGVYTVTLTVTDANGLSDNRIRNSYITANYGPNVFSFSFDVSDGVNSQQLTIGYNNDATDGFDNGLDVLAPPAGPAGTFDARTRSGSSDFFSDFRAESASAVAYNVLYAAANGNGPVVLSWNTADVPAGFNLSIVDNVTGALFGPVDMASVSSLDVSSAGGSLDNGLRILVTPPVSIQAFIDGPALPGLTIARDCTLEVTIKVDMSSQLSPNDLLGSFTANLDYQQGRLDYISSSGILSGYTGNVVVDEASGMIDFNGARIDGNGGVVDLLTLRFVVTGGIGSVAEMDLEFSAMAAANTFEDLLPALGITDFAATIAAKPLLGDVNGDGLVNSTDALIVLSYDAGLPIPQAFLDRINAGVGNVNADGDTNSTDALMILSYDVGIGVLVPIDTPFCP